MDYLQELYDDCHRLKQTVIELATESEDNDSSLGKINGGLLQQLPSDQNALQKHSAHRVPTFMRGCGKAVCETQT